MNSVKVITAPIYYINGMPHLGHLYTSIAVDILGRFEKAMGRESYTFFGTDEHGQKVEAAASQSSVVFKDIMSYADHMSAEFKKLLVVANIQPTEWIRTTDEDHKKIACWLWNRISENGFFYNKKYVGWYSKSDEAYYKSSEVEDGIAIFTGSSVEWMEEECVFFKLSAFKNHLLEHYSSNPDFVGPESKYKEAMGLLRQDMPDLAVSRTRFSWGIPAPDHPGHVMYVWLDALSNYLTGIMRLKERESPFITHFPSAEDFSVLGSTVHVMGKDILKFHSIYWPAFLLAAGLKLPKNIFAHGWLLINDEKMSKSRGNSLDPFDLLKEYGVDEIRYFFARGVNFGNDANFSTEEIDRLISSELANEIGNLAQRVLVFCTSKYGKILDFKANDEEAILDIWNSARKKAEQCMQTNEITAYVDAVRIAIAATNKYINDNKPWEMADPSQLMAVLGLCVQRMAILLWPVIPSAAEKIAALLSLPTLDVSYWDKVVGGVAVKPDPLFLRRSTPTARAG